MIYSLPVVDDSQWGFHSTTPRGGCVLFQNAFFQRESTSINPEIRRQRKLKNPDLFIEGNLTPTAIFWSGEMYKIDLPIKDIRRTIEQKTDEKGLRYICSINGKDRHVFLDMERYDRYRWYVESAEYEPKEYAE